MSKYRKCGDCGTVFDTSVIRACPECQSHPTKSFICGQCGQRDYRIDDEENDNVGGVRYVYCVSCGATNHNLSFCSICYEIKNRYLLIKRPGQKRHDYKRACQTCVADWYKKELSVIYKKCEDPEILAINAMESERIIKEFDVIKCTCNNIGKREVVKRATRVKIENVVVWCTSCGRSSYTISYSNLGNLDIRFIATIADYAMDGINICGVSGCNENGAAAHHYAPRGIFENAADWPIGYLCKAHHYEWHKKTKTGSFCNKE